MNIPIPLSWGLNTLKWIWNKITIFWLHKTYKQSHEYKLKRIQIGLYWEKLGDYLEYSLRLANPADHKLQKSEIAFRSTNVKLKNVRLFFEAIGNGICYQQKIEFVNLDKNIIIITLDQIPKLNVVIKTDDSIFFTINEIHFIECVVTHIDGEQCKAVNSKSLYLTHNWLLNDKWECRWGKLWNCNAIEDAKYEISAYWRWRLGEYDCFLFQPGSKKLSIQSLIRKLLCKVLIHRYILTLQFWLAIHSQCFILCNGKLIRKKNKKS